jgi:hypothetical protein
VIDFAVVQLEGILSQVIRAIVQAHFDCDWWFQQASIEVLRFARSEFVRVEYDKVKVSPTIVLFWARLILWPLLVNELTWRSTREGKVPIKMWSRMQDLV